MQGQTLTYPYIENQPLAANLQRGLEEIKSLRFEPQTGPLILNNVFSDPVVYHSKAEWTIMPPGSSKVYTFRSTDSRLDGNVISGTGTVQTYGTVGSVPISTVERSDANIQTEYITSYMAHTRAVLYEQTSMLQLTVTFEFLGVILLLLLIWVRLEKRIDSHFAHLFPGIKEDE